MSDWSSDVCSSDLMPSSEIYTGMQTGVLDAANTSSGSFVSYRLYEQVTCLTEPGDHALWFMYEPILMSKASWEELDEAQQKALMAASQKAEDYMRSEEHTSELQSLMRISYAVFCWK